MPRDSFTQLSSRSLGGRLGDALKGLVFGFLLVVISFPVLFINEGRAVRTHQTLQEGAGAVVSVAADRVDPVHEGRLVHVTGSATTPETLTDTEFAVGADALVLRRVVEMFQWKESRHSDSHKKLGGGEETRTTYTYTTAWSDRLESSAKFQDEANHRNPSQMPVQGEVFVAHQATLGAFALPADLVGRLRDFVPLPTVSGPEALPHHAKNHDGGFYIGLNPEAPQVGDVRIRFERVPPGAVSVIARQIGATFGPYTARTGKTLEMIRCGAADAAQMFAAAEQENRIITWLVRAGGFLLMFFGVLLLLRPIAVLADVVPFVGSLVGLGLGFVAFVGSLVCSTLTVAVAWIFYRPVFAVTLVVLMAVLVWFLVRRRNARTA